MTNEFAHLELGAYSEDACSLILRLANIQDLGLIETKDQWFVRSDLNKETGKFRYRRVSLSMLSDEAWQEWKALHRLD